MNPTENFLIVASTGSGPKMITALTVGKILMAVIVGLRILGSIVA
jgi:hypothetical protein